MFTLGPFFLFLLIVVVSAVAKIRAKMRVSAAICTKADWFICRYIYGDCVRVSILPRNAACALLRQRIVVVAANVMKNRAPVSHIKLRRHLSCARKPQSYASTVIVLVLFPLYLDLGLNLSLLSSLCWVFGLVFPRVCVCVRQYWKKVLYLRRSHPILFSACVFSTKLG